MEIDPSQMRVPMVTAVGAATLEVGYSLLPSTLAITNERTIESHSRAGTQYPPRAQNDHYYGRPNLSRPDSYSEAYVNPYAQPSGQQPRGNRHNQRMNGEPAPYANNAQNVYPQPAAHQSYDNMTSGSGSNSNRTDQWGNSTDPSSVNSSLDRLQQQQQQQNLEKTYGFSGFGTAPQLEYDQPEYGHPAPPAPAANGYGQNYAQSSMPPSVPPKQTSGPHHLQKTPSQTPTTEKKKSWFKKRFSKG